MREVTVTTRTLKRAAGLLVILLLAALAVWGWRPLFSWAIGRFQPSTPTPTPDPAATAAVQGAEAFYTIRAEEGAGGWADRMCRLVDDPDTCQVYREIFVPMLIAPLLSEHPGLELTAGMGEAVLVAEKHGGRDRIYRLQAVVQGLPQSSDAPLLVLVRRGDDGVWRFVRPLFEEEAAPYLATPTPGAGT